MPKFRKRPVVVEAVQYTGDNASEVVKLSGDGYCIGSGPVVYVHSDHLRLDKHRVFLNRDDWLVREPNGVLLCYIHDEFAAAYEPVEDCLACHGTGIEYEADRFADEEGSRDIVGPRPCPVCQESPE